MGRMGNLGISIGTIGNPQMSFENYEYFEKLSELKQKYFAGDINLMGDDLFSRVISKRKDVDQNGFIDVIAHGSSRTIQVNHNGKLININWREFSKLLKINSKYSKKMSVRLLSCNTGKGDRCFAQNLANKLNIIVMAPNDLLWCDANGTYFVAPRLSENKNSKKYYEPNILKKGKFIIYYPGGIIK